MGALEMTALGAVLLLAVVVGTFGVALAAISLWMLRRPPPDLAPEPAPEPSVNRLPQAPVAPAPAKVARSPSAGDPPTDEQTSPDHPLPGPSIGGINRFLKGDEGDESTEVFDQAKMSEDFAHLFVHDDDTTTSGVKRPAKPPKPTRPPGKG